MSKPKQEEKTNKRIIRQLEQQRKQKRMRIILWTTCICFAAIIAIAFIFTPKGSALDVDYTTAPQLGAKDAPVKIVEFGDFKCPSCKVFSQQIVPQLKKDYIDTGVVSFYFMNFPIIGPDSYTAALAGQAVFHQSTEEFWKFYDALFKNQQDEKIQWATPEFLVDFAQQQGIAVDYDKLKTDINSKTYAKEVDTQNTLASNKARMNSTPSLLINGKVYTDVFNYNSLKAAIEQAKNEKS